MSDTLHSASISNFILSAASPRQFFGCIVVKLLRVVEFMLQTPHNAPSIFVLMDIVPVKVPALLGLNVILLNHCKPIM